MKNLMYRLGAVAFLSFVIGATSVAYAASFDCSKASNKVENLICNDAELSQLDEYMAKLYRETRRVQSDGPTHLNAQRVWLKQRNQCEHQECLRSSYQQRIDQLALLASLETGHEPANTPVTINKPLFAMK